jgi:hypothetical protein
MSKQCRVYMLTSDQQQSGPPKSTKLKSTKLRLLTTDTALFTYLDNFSRVDALSSARTCGTYKRAE